MPNCFTISANFKETTATATLDLLMTAEHFLAWTQNYSQLSLWMKSKVWILCLPFRSTRAAAAFKCVWRNLVSPSNKWDVWHLKATRDDVDWVVNFNKLLSKHLASHLPRSAKKNVIKFIRCWNASSEDTCTDIMTSCDFDRGNWASPCLWTELELERLFLGG